MADIILVTGGARSGKSLFAQELAEKTGENKIFIATCPVIDPELKIRIEIHKRQRKQKGWKTVEETTHLANAVEASKGADVVLIDCLTLWINNLLYEAMNKKKDLGENEITDQCNKVLDAASHMAGTLIMVTNEVGMGIVPENQISRKYRDLLGRCNQIMAKNADKVILMVSGIPVKIKN